MKNLNPIVWLLTAVILLFPLKVLSQQSVAEAIDYSDPEEMVSDILDEVVTFYQNEEISTVDTYNFYRRLGHQYMDIKNIALSTLGRYRRTINEAQKNEFIPLFENYVLLKILDRADPLLKGDLSFKKMRAIERKPGYYQVIYRYTVNGSSPRDIIWTVIKHKKTGFYKIYDFHIDGISLLIAEREVFQKTINSGGIDGLIDKLHEWIENLEAKHF